MAEVLDRKVDSRPKAPQTFLDQLILSRLQDSGEDFPFVTAEFELKPSYDPLAGRGEIVIDRSSADGELVSRTTFSSDPDKYDEVQKTHQTLFEAAVPGEEEAIDFSRPLNQREIALLQIALNNPHLRLAELQQLTSVSSKETKMIENNRAGSSKTLKARARQLGRRMIGR